MEHLDVGEAVSKRLVKQLRVEHRALYQLQETRDQQNKAYQIESSERLTQSEETQKRLEGQHRMLQHKIENLETMVEDMRKDIQAVRSEEMLVCQEMRARLAELEMSIAKNYTDCVAYLRSAGAPYEEPHGSQELGDNVELLRALDGGEKVLVEQGNIARERVTTPAISPITTAHTSFSPRADRIQSNSTNPHPVPSVFSPFVIDNQQDRSHQSNALVQQFPDSVSQSNSLSSEYEDDDDLDASMRLPKTVWESRKRQSESRPKTTFTTAKVAQPTTSKNNEATSAQSLNPLQASNASQKRLDATRAPQSKKSTAKSYDLQPSTHQQGRSDQGQEHHHEREEAVYYPAQIKRATVPGKAPLIDSLSQVATSTNSELSRKRTLPQPERVVHGAVNKKKIKDARSIALSGNYLPLSGDVEKDARNSTVPRETQTNAIVATTDELPRLRQGKKKLSNYYKEANLAFTRYNDKSDEGHQRYVNHFLNGIYLVRVRNVAIEKLQQLQESTFRNDKVWIICHWEDVMDALIAAELLTMDEVG